MERETKAATTHKAKQKKNFIQKLSTFITCVKLCFISLRCFGAEMNIPEEK